MKRLPSSTTRIRQYPLIVLVLQCFFQYYLLFFHSKYMNSKRLRFSIFSSTNGNFEILDKFVQFNPRNFFEILNFSHKIFWWIFLFILIVIFDFVGLTWMCSKKKKSWQIEISQFIPSYVSEKMRASSSVCLTGKIFSSPIL